MCPSISVPRDGMLPDSRSEPHNAVTAPSIVRLARQGGGAAGKEGQVFGFSRRRRPRHPFIVQRSIFFLAASLFKHDLWISLTPEDTVETGPETDGNGNSRRTVAAGASESPDSAMVILRVKVITSATTLDAKAEPAALSACQLTKRFGKRTAFSEVSFEVAYGEVFGFLGPNGAGKANIGNRHFFTSYLVTHAAAANASAAMAGTSVTSPA